MVKDKNWKTQSKFNSVDKLAGKKEAKLEKVLQWEIPTQTKGPPEVEKYWCCLGFQVEAEDKSVHRC